uniref:Cysteine and glycine-rich protein 3 n=1 Tax=Schistocephalus solidus TaxID=70667 RepID=A0A0X3Q747_SCHSO
MNLEINPEFLDIEAEFRKNLNFLLVQKKNGLHTSEMISDTIFLGNIPQRVSPEIVNKTDESLNATPSLDTLPSKIQPFIVKTEHLLSIPEEQSSLTESGFETSENSQTEFMSNINETTKLFHSASLRDSRSSFTIFDENMPPTFALASKNPPLSTRNRGSRVQSLASTFEQIFSNIPENQPARLNATRASRGKQDPASIGDASRRPLVNGQSKRQLLQADFSELKGNNFSIGVEVAAPVPTSSTRHRETLPFVGCL